MTETARRDLAGEGFDPDSAEVEVERDTGERDGRVDVVRVRARQRLESFDPPAASRRPAATAAPSTRTLLLPDGSSVDAPVHDWTTLAPGTRLDGPAVAAGGSMTCLVPPGLGARGRPARRCRAAPRRPVKEAGGCLACA